MANLSTKEKAVYINLKSNYYGTIAEIGGGQETARHLFQAGGASNTIAKSVSAYDKLFSDHFYNDDKSARYVSLDRLRKMVNYEYDELIHILDKKNEQRFFAFGNTVETLNFLKTNHGNGWVGIAVEGTDRYRPNLFFIHIKLHENDTLLQQYSLGTLGINLIHAGLFTFNDPRDILLSLLDNLDTNRVEIDYVYVEGPDVHWVDNRLLNLMLVSNNMTPAIMFDINGQVQQPSDLLYRKNVLLMRGYFRPINSLGMEFLEESLEIFKRDEDYTPENTIEFCEISLNYLMKDEVLDEMDFLHRVDLLNIMGQSVMISNFKRYFELVNYFRQYKLIKLRLIIGLPTFEKVLDNSYYQDLLGGRLEALGAMFQDNVKVYLFPKLDSHTAEIIYPTDGYFKGNRNFLWQYINAKGSIVLLKNFSRNILNIRSEHISSLIDTNDIQLQKFIPEKVFDYMKANKLFGYNPQMD
jgi:hypothetical protein